MCVRKFNSDFNKFNIVNWLKKIKENTNETEIKLKKTHIKRKLKKAEQ